MTERAFELQKNTKAFSYTALICALLLLFVFLTKLTIKIPPIQYPPDLIEVNLGNDKEGRGDIQPLIKGTPGQESEHNAAPTKVAVTATKDIEADNSDNPDAATVSKSPKPNKEVKTVVPVVNKTKNNNTVADKQPVKKPKSVYGGGNGTGGNNANEDNGYKDHGNKDGSGDIGSPNGTPTGRVFGVRNVSFGNLKDEFNENAKVAVLVTVNAAGIVTDARVIDKGTTTTNPSLRSMAQQKARQLKFPVSKAEQETGTIIFNFKVKD
jgi:hypothetical protein